MDRITAAEKKKKTNESNRNRRKNESKKRRDRERWIEVETMQAKKRTDELR